MLRKHVDQVSGSYCFGDIYSHAISNVAAPTPMLQLDQGPLRR